MGKKNNKLALMGLLTPGITGCLNNTTEEEKREANNFLKDPDNAKCVDFGDGKIIKHPVAVLRIWRIIAEYGIQGSEILNKLIWGYPEDGKNTALQFKTARDLLEKILKGGK